MWMGDVGDSVDVDREVWRRIEGGGWVGVGGWGSFKTVFVK